MTDIAITIDAGPVITITPVDGPVIEIGTSSSPTITLELDRGSRGLPGTPADMTLVTAAQDAADAAQADATQALADAAAAQATADAALPATDPSVTNARTPTAHASSHVGGSDPIAAATAGNAGLMSATQASQLAGLVGGVILSVQVVTVAGPTQILPGVTYVDCQYTGGITYLILPALADAPLNTLITIGKSAIDAYPISVSADPASGVMGGIGVPYTLARSDSTPGLTTGVMTWDLWRSLANLWLLTGMEQADQAASIASLRTLGTGAMQAAAGNDSRLSDTRTPTDASVTMAKLASMAANTIIARQSGAGTPSALAASASPSTLGTDPTGALAHYPAVQAEWGRVAPSHGTRRASVYATDFASWNSASVGANEGGWLPATSGTGSSVSINAGIAGRIGLASIYAGTASNGRSAVYLNDALCLFGGGRHSYQCEHRLFSLSDGTNTYTAWAGWINTANSASTPTNGAFFRYTHGTNSGKYQCVTVSAGAENATDSGVTASASVFHDMEIEVNAAATSVRFWIDGVQVGGTHSTAANIPTATGRECGPAIKILNSLGTAGVRATLADFLAYRFDPTTAR